MKTHDYIDFIENCYHEILVKNYIKQLINTDDCRVYEFRDKFIALVKKGEDITQGANIIVSHIDSPRLDAIVGNPFIQKDDGFFIKVVPYGGLIYQDWINMPLFLTGRIYSQGKEIFVDTRGKHEFTITGLLPHLNGRDEMKKINSDKFLIRLAKNKEVFLEKMKELYGLSEKDFELADLSFIPSFNAKLLGFDSEYLSSYGHDDKCCVFAQLKAFLNSDDTSKTKIAIFSSYEETGSAQSTGCQSEIINDIFLDLTNNYAECRKAIRNSKVISADVCAGYESKFSNHFEECARAVVGNGIGVIPYLGQKRGNDTDFHFRNEIKELLIRSNIPYQIETTKVSESGGGTVSTFFATKGCYVIDVGIPVLAMHSPQEIISVNDLDNLYKFYKVFYELE